MLKPINEDRFIKHIIGAQDLIYCENPLIGPEGKIAYYFGDGINYKFMLISNSNLSMLSEQLESFQTLQNFIKGISSTIGKGWKALDASCGSNIMQQAYIFETSYPGTDLIRGIIYIGSSQSPFRTVDEMHMELRLYSIKGGNIIELYMQSFASEIFTESQTSGCMMEANTFEYINTRCLADNFVLSDEVQSKIDSLVSELTTFFELES